MIENNNYHYTFSLCGYEGHSQVTLIHKEEFTQEEIDTILTDAAAKVCYNKSISEEAYIPEHAEADEIEWPYSYRIGEFGDLDLIIVELKKLGFIELVETREASIFTDDIRHDTMQLVKQKYLQLKSNDETIPL